MFGVEIGYMADEMQADILRAEHEDEVEGSDGDSRRLRNRKKQPEPEGSLL
jgi:hypothetical protein